MKRPVRLIIALVTALSFGVVSPGHATTTLVKVADGSLQAYSAVPAEEILYTQGGCSKDSPNGEMAAFINVKKYAGKTIVVKLGTAAYAPVFQQRPTIYIQSHPTCTIQSQDGSAYARPNEDAWIAITNQVFLSFEIIYESNVGVTFSVWHT